MTTASKQARLPSVIFASAAGVALAGANFGSVEAILATILAVAAFLFAILLCGCQFNFSPTMRKVVIFATCIAIGFYSLIAFEYAKDHRFFSLFAIVVGVCNLVIGLLKVEDGIETGLPKSNEWGAAFYLLVVTMWIYLEIIRLAHSGAGQGMPR